MATTNFSTISELFKSSIFQLPKNQRGYSWGESQRSDVFNDLAETLPDHKHYFGPVVITYQKKHHVDERGNRTASLYYLDDGQQRLTTYYLFLHVLNKKFEEILRNAQDNQDKAANYKFIKNDFLDSEGVDLDRLQKLAEEINNNAKLDNEILKIETKEEYLNYSKKISKIIKKVNDKQPFLKEILYADYDVDAPKVRRLQNENQKLHVFFNDLLDEKINPNTQLTTSPQRALYKAYQETTTRFDENKFNDLEKIYEDLIERSLFMRIDLSSAEIDRNLAFDAINTRGLKLGEFDIIKNYALLIESRCEWRDENRSEKRDDFNNIEITNEWFESLQQLDRFKLKYAKEKPFIQEFLNVFFGGVYTKTSDKFRGRYEELTHKHLDPSKESKLIEELLEFIRYWSIYAQSFGYVSTPDHSFRNGNFELTLPPTGPAVPSSGTPKRLGTPQSSDLILCINDGLDREAVTRPILTVCHMRFSENEFEEIATLLEVLVFRVFSIMKRRVNSLQKELIKLSHFVLHNKISANDVKSAICYFLTEHKHKATIQECVDEVINWNTIYPGDRSVKGWRALYYFLYQYDCSMGTQRLSDRIINFKKDKPEDGDSIEHILPKTYHSADNEWKNDWDEQEHEKWKHRLGNLVMTLNNSILGTSSIDVKMNGKRQDGTVADHFFNHINATDSEKKLKDYLKDDLWIKESILRRELDLLTFLIKKWSGLCCDDEKSIIIDFTSIINKLEGDDSNLHENDQFKLEVSFPQNSCIEKMSKENFESKIFDQNVWMDPPEDDSEEDDSEN